MTTHSRPASAAASTDRRTAYRRMVLAAARAEPLEDIAAVGLAGACATSGWPVGQIRLVDLRQGSRWMQGRAAVHGLDRRADLADELTGVLLERDSAVTTAVTTARPAWSNPDRPGGIARLAVPVTGHDVVGVMELIDDRHHEVGQALLDGLVEIAEVLGAVIGRDRDATAAGVAGLAPEALPPSLGARRETLDVRAALERLELDQQRLREAEVIGNFGVWELLPGRAFAWSEQLCRIHGVPSDFLPTLEANLALIHPDDLHRIDNFTEQMRSERAAPPQQYRIVRPNGEIRWVESHVRVLAGDRVIGITRDVTEQRAREQRERLQSQIVQTMAEGVCLVRADGTIVYVNPQYAAMFGYEPEEMEGERIWDFNAPEHRPPPGTVTEPRPVAFHGELRHVHRDGSIFVTEANVTPMPVDGGEPGELAWLAVERDITEEKARSEALRDSEERLALIQQHAPIGLALVDPEGCFVQANPALCAITGRSDDELARLTLRDITHPDDVEETERGIEQLLKGEIPLYEVEQRYVRPDGEVVWIAATVAAARDEDGVPRHLIAQVMDIGARKQAEEARARHAAELERSNAELLRASRKVEKAHRAAVEANRAKNQFLSRMSHELRTPLNAVLGFAQLLGMEDLTETQLDMVDEVLRGGRHLLVLIDEVLDIARMEDGTMTVSVEPVEVAAAFDHARSLVEPLLRGREVRLDALRLDGDGPDPVIAADRRRVIQILVNLLSNAVKYNRPGGAVSVTVAAGDEVVRIAVADTGPGIAPDVLPRVFEPFDRLGAEQTGVEGTGIGLTVSRALAEQMGGSLTVESAVGTGSTFLLELPRHHGGAPAEAG